jgi:hypothetical protein
MARLHVFARIFHLKLRVSSLGVSASGSLASLVELTDSDKPAASSPPFPGDAPVYLR